MTKRHFNSLTVTGSLIDRKGNSVLVLSHQMSEPKLAIAEPLQSRRSLEVEERQKMTNNRFDHHLLTFSFLPSWPAFPGIRKTSVSPQMTMTPTWIPISAHHLQKLLAWANGQHHVGSFGASIYTMSYVFSLFFSVVSFSIDQRVTMGCRDSTLARPNSRISSTSLAMTRASHHSPNHVAAGPIVCYRIWDTSAIVSLILAFLTSHVCVANEFPTFFLFIYFCYA